MKLLIVEDDSRTLSLMARGLADEGFEVQTCCDGEEGLRQAESKQYDLVILDVMLPRIDGFAILSQLRAAHNTTRVVLLTARDGIDHRVKGLGLGADDYIVKPFAFAELVARIRTVLRRPGTADILQCKDLQLDPIRRRVIRSEKLIDLSAKEFSLIELLLRHKGEVLSREFIAEQIWGGAFSGESNFVEANIRRLRSKIDSDFPVKLIKTIRGSGYVIR